MHTELGHASCCMAISTTPLVPLLCIQHFLPCFIKTQNSMPTSINPGDEGYNVICMTTQCTVHIYSSPFSRFRCMFAYYTCICTTYTHIYMQVDTEVCEQTFSWLSRFSRITRHMNRQHFLFYILYICDLRNRMKV